MKKLISALVLCVVIGSGCRINLTPSQIAGLVTAVQTAIGVLPNVPTSVVTAFDVAQKAMAADASGKKWPAIARVALTTLYEDLPPAQQSLPAVEVAVTALEVVLEEMGA